jgi:hypothetical protein
VSIKLGVRPQYLGSYDTEASAAARYDEVAALHGKPGNFYVMPAAHAKPPPPPGPSAGAAAEAAAASPAGEGMGLEPPAARKAKRPRGDVADAEPPVAKTAML